MADTAMRNKESDDVEMKVDNSVIGNADDHMVVDAPEMKMSDADRE